MAVSVVGGVAAQPAAAAEPSGRWERSTILVRFAAPARASSLVARLGDTVAGTTAGGVTVVRLAAGGRVQTTVARYRKLPGVRYAEPNYRARRDLASPNDPSYGRQWALSKIEAGSAWGIYPGSFAVRGGMRIAIVDTGVDPGHSELDDGRVRTDLGANCLGPAGCAAGSALDDNGHGTHVAGIAAAETDNGTGVAGLAYTSSIVPVKVLDSTATGSYAAIANGIAWAVDHGARVVNLSLGGSDPSQTLCDAVSAALARNALVVAAAGNDSSSAKHYPAACPGALGVAATTSSDGHSSYSNTGTGNVFVSAPGDSILSTYKGNSYATMTGTSMSTPLVTALAALLLGEVPGRSVDDVKTVLATTSDKVGSGYGTDPYGTCAGCTWSSSFGYGRINAYKALAQRPPQADFGFAVSPRSLRAPLGGIGSATVDLQAYNGFAGDVAFTASGLPAGALAHFVPGTVSAPGTAELVVTVPPTATTGSYLVRLTGTSGSLTHTTTLALTVTGIAVAVPASSGPLPQPPAAVVGAQGFTLEAVPGQRSVLHGYATAFLLRTTASGTFTGPIALTVGGLPPGATAAFAPTLLTAPGEGSLAIATTAATPPGTYALTITGTAGSLVVSAPATLVVV